jgi:hypothetical protein
LCLIILKKELGEKVLCQPLFLWEWVLQKKTMKSIIDSRGQRHPPPIAHNRSRTKADDIRATKFRPRLKKPPNVLSYPREYRFSAREKTHIFFSHKLSLKGSFQSASTISEKMKFANGSSSSRTDATDVSTATKLPRTKHKKYEKKSQKNDT